MSNYVGKDPVIKAMSERPITVVITPKCDHDWSGREVATKNGRSVSCAKCGMLAIDDAMRG